MWEEWMTAGEHSFTKTGRMRRATYADVCGWVVTAWKHVNVSCIRSGFRKAEIYCSADTDSDSDMDTEIADNDNDLPAEIAALFHSDSEGEDFKGFIPSE